VQWSVPCLFSCPHRRQSHGLLLGKAAGGAPSASSLEVRDTAEVGRDTGRLEDAGGSAVAVCGGLLGAGSVAIAESTTPPANTAHATGRRLNVSAFRYNSCPPDLSSSRIGLTRFVPKS
jgi:hypothetical protein